MGGMMDGWVVDDLVLEDEELFVESGIWNQENLVTVMRSTASDIDILFFCSQKNSRKMIKEKKMCLDDDKKQNILNDNA